MNIIIKETSSVPIYEQIIQAVRSAVLCGELSPGDMLPSIRSLAKALGISVITTKRAYEELEQQNLIYSQSGKGFFICEPNLSQLYEEQKKHLEAKLLSCIAEGKKYRMTLDELQKIVSQLWKGSE